MRLLFQLWWYNNIKRHWNDWRWYLSGHKWMKSGRITRKNIEWANGKDNE